MPVSQLKTELYYTSIAQLVPTGKLWNIISCNLSLSSCGSIPAVSISELFVATNLTNRDNNESNKCTNQSYHKYESFANTIALPVQMCIDVVSLIKRITWMINSSQLPHHGPVVKWRKSLDRHFFGNNVPAEDFQRLREADHALLCAVCSSGPCFMCWFHTITIIYLS